MSLLLTFQEQLIANGVSKAISTKALMTKLPLADALSRVHLFGKLMNQHQSDVEFTYFLIGVSQLPPLNYQDFENVCKYGHISEVEKLPRTSDEVSTQVASEASTIEVPSILNSEQQFALKFLLDSVGADYPNCESVLRELIVEDDNEPV